MNSIINATRIWWQQLKFSEKVKLFRKHFSSGVTSMIDLTAGDIDQMYFGTALPHREDTSFINQLEFE